MDICAAKYRGASLSWEATPGPVHPAHFEREGLGWLRTFHGGLLAGCGLTSAGAPCVDEGQALGLHGRLNHIPAAGVWADGAWRGDEYEMWVRGHMRQTVVFGENLTLTRRIWAHLGESRLFIRDVVANEGFGTTPHMMLYHCNFGFPLLDEGTELLAPSQRVTPRDAVAAPGLDGHACYEAPILGYQEQCFYHQMIRRRGRLRDGHPGQPRLRRRARPGRLRALSPGRAAAVHPVEDGRRRHLRHRPGAGELPGGGPRQGPPARSAAIPGAGQTREYVLEIGVLGGNDAIDQMVARLPQPA